MINKEWPLRPLEELFEIGAGKTMSAAARDGIDKTPFLRTSNVLWDKIDLTTVDEMAIPTAELESKLLRAGDLLVCEGGEIGRAAIWNGDVPRMSFQNHLHRLRPLTDDIEPHFYVYFFQSAFTQLGIFEGAGNQTTIPNLSRNRLASLEVPQPPLDEQRAIVTAVSRVRKAICLHDQSIAIVDRLKAAAIRDLFTRGLRGEPQKETKIGPIPESWEVSTLESQSRTISKGSSPKWQGFDYVKSGVFFVRSQNVGDGKLLLNDTVYLPREWNEKERRSILRCGDVLINLVGASIGRVALGGHEIEEANCNQAVCFVRVNAEKLLGAFLVGFLLTDSGQEQIHRSKKDIARANLSLEDVRNLLVPVPSLDQQREIVEIIDAVDRKIDLHQRKRAVLIELFNTLLNKLMTGEVTVSDLEDLVRVDMTEDVAAV